MNFNIITVIFVVVVAILLGPYYRKVGGVQVADEKDDQQPTEPAE